LTKSILCDTFYIIAIQGGLVMPISLRIPPEKEKLIQKAAKKSGSTKTAVILEAVDEKLGLTKTREQLIRELAGWLTHEEAAELRKSVEVFSQINQGDWE
jgi:predicted transcriptional regulator